MNFIHAGRTYTLWKRDGTDTGDGPWYMRHGNSRFSLHTADRTAATARAKDELRKRAEGTDLYASHRAAHALRNQLTIADLAARWIASGCPQPNGNARPVRAQSDQTAVITRALRWWGARPVASIQPHHLREFADHRKSSVSSLQSPASPHRTGGRTVDRELQSLSNLFTWAMFSGHAKANPFAARCSFADPAAVRHSSEACPQSDADLHALCAHIWHAGHEAAAAQLMFQALTGLRPGEPGLLHFHARPGQPGSLATRTIAGTLHPILHIARRKGGCNPAVDVHPALRAFLDWWLPHIRTTHPTTRHWFPDPADPSAPLYDSYNPRHAKRLTDPLHAATHALGLRPMRPHAMRAYYVLVRRSQGIADATIGHELGENTGAKLIARTYGSPETVFATGAHDWLPTPPAVPWWTAISVPATNLIPLPSTSNPPDADADAAKSGYALGYTSPGVKPTEETAIQHQETQCDARSNPLTIGAKG